MPSNFPDSFDTFVEPSFPEDTPLASAGSGDRNHPEHHRDLGDAVEAIQRNVALKGHDHSGEDDRVHGPKLLQSNTHQSPDTDLGPTSLHHTLGTGANQAARGNHNHDYNNLLNVPLLRCLSSSRPGSPYEGLMIYETDTGCFRIWEDFNNTGSMHWCLLPVANKPTCRLRQSKSQKLVRTGTTLEWSEEIEDNFGFFDKTISQTNVVVKEQGKYDLSVSLQWDPQFVPDQAHVVVLQNGAETTIRDSKFLRGNGLVPSFSQTLTVAAPIQCEENDILTVRARYEAAGNLLERIFSFFDLSSKVNSRFDLIYRGPL